MSIMYWKIFIQMLFLSMIFLCSYGQKYRFHESYVKKVNFIDSIDYTIQNGLILIEADPENKGEKYTFVFDCSSPTILTSDIAKIVELNHEGNYPAYVSLFGFSTSALGTLNYIKMGEIEFESVSTYIVQSDIFKINGFENISGVIGSNLMNACVWQIVPERRKIIICSAKSYLKVPTNAEKMKMKLTKSIYHPILNFKYDSQNFVGIFRLNFDENLNLRGEIGKYSEKGNLQIGSLSIPVGPIETHLNPEHHYLGIGALTKKTVTLDFIIEKFYIH